MRYFLFAISMFVVLVSCEQHAIDEFLPLDTDTPNTITIAIDESTRIQLNEDVKTVWSSGDEVSLFYRSDANQRWQYNGETGVSSAELTMVDEGYATTNIQDIVAIYPYNADYRFNTMTYELSATLPTTQHYMEHSYGLDGNIMVAVSSDDNLTLRSLLGWIKIQLTGSGERVTTITLRGNGGEQLAGDVVIDVCNTSLSLLQGDNASTEVTLDCPNVTLTASPVAFYIAIPPQHFTDGITVIVECDGYAPMTLTTTNEICVERNHIQPMATMEYSAHEIEHNEIWYSATSRVEPYAADAFGATILSNEWNSSTREGVITFDGEVTAVGEYAFYECSTLTSISLPRSTTEIGKGAFAMCSSLKSVPLSGNIVHVGDGAFAGCSRITSATIPDSVTSIGEGAFAACPRLGEFRGRYAEDDGRCLIVGDTIVAFAPVGRSSYTIPEGVVTIGVGTFALCHNLKSVTIPGSVKSIEYAAFTHCIALSSITIPDSVTTIDDYAFYWCYAIQSVTLGEGVTSIGDSTFYYCDALKNITIPNSVEHLGEYAFYSCSSLSNITLGSGIIEIEYAAFAACTGLTNITIPNGVKVIGDGAFYGCSSLATAIIGDDVTAIGRFAFQYCTALEEVSIGANVQSIGMQAFYYCCNLDDVYCLPSTPPTLGAYAFDYNADSRTIYVPASAVAAYAVADDWSRYGNSIVSE